MKLLLTRHGQTDWNVAGRIQGMTDIELNETGIRQAEEVREKLLNENIDVIITSPLKRARQQKLLEKEEIYQLYMMPKLEKDVLENLKV